MKKIILIASVLMSSFALSSCSFNFYGVSSSSSECHSHAMISDTINVDDFEALSAYATTEVVYSQGDENKVIYEVCEEIIDKIDIKVKNNSLNLGVYGENINHKFKCTVIGKSPLNKVDVSGCSKMIYNGDLKCDDVDLECSGASSIKVNGVVETKYLDVDLSGASHVTLNVVCEDLSVDVSGASNAVIKGTTRNADLDASGASSVDADEMNVVNLSAEASGASHILATATGKTKISESGVSSVKVQNK
jgi:hypothetical protein